MMGTTPAIERGTDGTLKILDQLLLVMQQSRGVDKNGALPLGTNQAPIMRIDDIIMQYRPRLIEHGILTIPRLVTQTVYRDEAEENWSAGDVDKGIAPRRIQNGKVRSIRVHVVVEVETTWVSTLDGSSITTLTPGEAMDTQDKATRKAMTSAKKIAFIDLFQIITGDPEEDDDWNARVEKQAAEETAALAPGRNEQKIARAVEGTGTTAAPRKSDLPQSTVETAPIASDEADSEDRGKALIREFVKAKKVPAAKLMEFGEELHNAPRSSWVGKITKVKALLAEAETEAFTKFVGEGE